MKFDLGDTVIWTSQAGSYSKKKRGEVVGIVSCGEQPDPEKFPDLYKGLGSCGMGRRETSYVVKVGRKHYWPRTCHLRRKR